MDAHLVEILWLTGTVLFGLLNCYFGYRLFLITVAISGFLIGGLLGYMIGMWTGNWIIGLVAAVVLGLIAGWASVMAYYAFIFIVGAIGFALASSFIAGLFYADVHVLIPIVAGLIGGLLALWLQRVIIIVATATQGALASILATATLISGGGMSGYRAIFRRFLEGDLNRTGGIWFYLGVALWLILAISGMVVQFGSGKEMYRVHKPPATES